MQQLWPQTKFLGCCLAAKQPSFSRPRRLFGQIHHQSCLRMQVHFGNAYKINHMKMLKNAMNHMLKNWITIKKDSHSQVLLITMQNENVIHFTLCKILKVKFSKIDQFHHATIMICYNNYMIYKKIVQIYLVQYKILLYKNLNIHYRSHWRSKVMEIFSPTDFSYLTIKNYLTFLYCAFMVQSCIVKQYPYNEL